MDVFLASRKDSGREDAGALHLWWGSRDSAVHEVGGEEHVRPVHWVPR